MNEIYRIICEKGDFAQEIEVYGGEPFEYLISDRYEMWPSTTVAWCFRCNIFREVESLSPVDAIEDALKYTTDHDTLRQHFAETDSEIVEFLGRSVRDRSDHITLEYRDALRVK